MDQQNLSNPKAVAEEGERIYREKYQADFEQKYRGWFVLIDVRTEKAYQAETAPAAVDIARKDAPDGVFHIIRVGEPGAFRVSYRSSAEPDWVLS
jgi:rhodanese-related sulfurtransferase